MMTHVDQLTFDANFATNLEALVQTRAAQGYRLASSFPAPGTIEIVLIFVA